MKARYLIALIIFAVPLVARAATELYIGMGELIIPIDGASETQTIEMNQFFGSFSGTRFYFRVREGYESELISLGTPMQTNNAGLAIESASESVAVSSDAAAASEPEQSTPAILGPFEVAGVYTYDTETGIDRGMDCEKPSMRKVGLRTFEFICPKLMEM